MVRKSGKPDLRRRISANPALRSASRKIATDDSALASATYKYNLIAKIAAFGNLSGENATCDNRNASSP
jgi:hypothetical protein